jgi:hypothetical protein
MIKPEDLTYEMLAGYFGEYCECRGVKFCVGDRVTAISPYEGVTNIFTAIRPRCEGSSTSDLSRKECRC